jgi:hypothetical protein
MEIVLDASLKLSILKMAEIAMANDDFRNSII